MDTEDTEPKGERVYKLRDLLWDRNLARVAEQLNLTRSATRHWRDGRTVPSKKRRPEIARYFGLPESQIDWGEAA